MGPSTLYWPPVFAKLGAMALVSAGGMGEAVLGYGDDGIASETVRDGGGVFVRRLTSGAKEIRLVAGLQQPEHEDKEGRRGRGVRVLMGEPDAGDGDANRREVGRLVKHHLLNVGLDSDLISKAARLANGSAAHDSAKEKPVVNGVTAEKGGSHASTPGSPDQLVEMAIKCLDDKVWTMAMGSQLHVPVTLTFAPSLRHFSPPPPSAYYCQLLLLGGHGGTSPIPPILYPSNFNSPHYWSFCSSMCLRLRVYQRRTICPGLCASMC